MEHTTESINMPLQQESESTICQSQLARERYAPRKRKKFHSVEEAEEAAAQEIIQTLRKKFNIECVNVAVKFIVKFQKGNRRIFKNILNIDLDLKISSEQRTQSKRF